MNRKGPRARSPSTTRCSRRHSFHVQPDQGTASARVIARFGRAPPTVTADRGYDEAAVDSDLGDLGVQRVVIPRKRRPGAARQATQRKRSLRKLGLRLNRTQERGW
jgi:IS5 family transposase